jgi:hypothetical protein
MQLMKRIISLQKYSGKLMTVQYLKEANRMIVSYLSGNPATCIPGGVRVGSKHSLPILLPHLLRMKIVRNDVVGIRIILGLIQVYRVINVKGQLKLSTITDPFKGDSSTLNRDVLEKVFKRFILPIRGLNPKGRNSLLALKTAGPNHRVSILGAAIDCVSFNTNNSHLLAPFRVIANYFGSNLYRSLKYDYNLLKDLHLSVEPKLGKLSKKLEPAGKIRVFAICDVWSQSILVPIHDHLFEILSRIPMDGTFDQEAPLRNLLAKLQTRADKTVFSYDLSAATDRFPIDFQVQVLSLLYTKDVAEAWKSLLVDREYYLKDEGNFKYSVGQPMGALSSWATFALSHHLLVQYVAETLGYPNFDDYALLGDDIVIANKEVAQGYYNLVTAVFGVDINLSKSVISDHGLVEFAKRLVSPEYEYTPVGPKNITLSLRAPGNIPTLIRDLISKGVVLDNRKVEEMINALSHLKILKISKSGAETLL